LIPASNFPVRRNGAVAVFRLFLPTVSLHNPIYDRTDQVWKYVFVLYVYNLRTSLTLFLHVAVPQAIFYWPVSSGVAVKPPLAFSVLLFHNHSP